VREFAAFIACSTLIACAAHQSSAALDARRLSSDAAVTRAELDQFGHRLYDALSRGQLAGLALDDGALRSVLLPDAAQRALTRRAQSPAIHVPTDARALFGAARYAGICVQQGRVEPEAGVVGLRHVGFLFERALLVGREPGGGAIASWVEGRFVHTTNGFEVLDFDRVESPRRDHADLDLAVCELRAGAFGHNP
jgi:hypothetical protein